MELLKKLKLSNDLTFIIRGQPNEHGFNGINLLCEWDDNSLGYGGTSVVNKVIPYSNGTHSIIRANNGSQCSDIDFENKYVGKALDIIKRNKSKSVGQALLGGSVSTHNFSYNEKVGYCTEFGEHRIATYIYDVGDKNIEELSPDTFMDSLQGISVEIHSVTRDEFCDAHNLGKNYNGWFNIAKTFKDLPFKIDYSGIVNFSRERYQYKAGKLVYLYSDTDKRTIKPFYFPEANGNLISHYSNMEEVLNSEDSNFHEFNLGDSYYSYELYSYETIRASQRDKLLTLFQNVRGESNVHPSHLQKLDFPTVDVISPDGTFISVIELWPGAKQWPAEYNNRKYILVLSAESTSPFARMKTKFRNSNFEKEIRKRVKLLAKTNALLSETSGEYKKKLEDAEVVNYKNILQDEQHQSNPVALKNLEKITGDLQISICKIAANNDTEYSLKLDLTFDATHLIEWQTKQMDDEHFTELIARITMPDHKFKTVLWVHGGQSDNLISKLRKHLNSGRINLKGIEQINIIHKDALYNQGGYNSLQNVYTNK